MTEEQRAKRLRHHLYETCEGIKGQSERIVNLEELVIDLWALINTSCRKCDCYVQLSSSVGTCRLSECKLRRAVVERMRELDIEVGA